ncbi:MAG TPA: ATP-binding cassette domain-containing protein, partial [Chloroflexota bacterium]|nr:ATP-binding cassette domain-containing protein [Chloroflexota bacterium]
MPALREVSCSIRPGERVLLSGASGSGKSTLGLCLSGLIPLSLDADMSGVALVDGLPTMAYPHGDLAERVGTVFQDPTSQFTMLTVDDEVAFGLENLGVPPAEMPARVQAALESVGLAERTSWRIDRLSGGQQQRLALAATLAMQPAALVLDEPTAHLDPRNARSLYSAIASAADATDATLVFIEHDLDRLLPHLPERALLLDRDGLLVADALLPDLFRDPATARSWQALGVRLPTPTALALDESEYTSLPVSFQEGVRWLRDHRWHGAPIEPAAPRSLGEDVVRARGLRLRYSSPAGSYLALRDVDLTVAEGELVALVGANGSGKTTLLRALTGLLPLEEGAIRIGGMDLRGGTPRQVASLVAHVFQNPEAGFVADTVEDEVAYGPRALGWPVPEVEAHARTLLERFGLQVLGRANPFTLSQGQKRRLSVATSLVLGPRVLLLDEPTFGQDRQSAEALLDEIARLRDQGLAIVVATHDLSLVRRIADRVVALADGEVLFDGPYSALIADAALVERIGQEV